jgi:hypothetical protein
MFPGFRCGCGAETVVLAQIAVSLDFRKRRSIVPRDVSFLSPVMDGGCA